MKNQRRLVPCILLSLILGLVAAGGLPTEARSQEALDLQLGGTGSISWDIGNIQPNDSGTETVTLHNAGFNEGRILIWVSDIVSSEGTNPESETGNTEEPGELMGYLLLNPLSERLSTNQILPNTVDNLPHSSNDPNFIKVNSIGAGETITLTWEWEFRETGAPQNDAQGDSLSFTINYFLDEFLSSTGTDYYGDLPYQPWFDLDILGKKTTIRLDDEGRLRDSVTVTDINNRVKLEFAPNTILTSTSGQPITMIEIKVSPEPLAPPANMVIIGPTYDFIGYVGDSIAPSIIFSQPVELTLSYDPEMLPENIASMFIAWYDTGQYWQAIGLATGSGDRTGNITTTINHASTFAILAELSPGAPVPVESAPEEQSFAEPVPAEKGPDTGSIPISPEPGIDTPGISPGSAANQATASTTLDHIEPLRQSSLAVAVTGVVAMTILTYIQRRKRVHHNGKSEYIEE